MLILVIAILLICAAIAWLKFGGVDPSAYSNINMFDGQISFPTYWIPFAILAFVVFLLALWLLGKIFSAPKAIKRGNKSREAARSRDSLDRGLMEIGSGDFEKGEATLTSHLDGGASDAPKYLAAAKSAEARGAHEQANHYLKKASDSSNDSSFAVRTAQAEMMMGRGEYDKAETLLTNLHTATPGNAHIMGLLATTLQQTGNAEKMSRLTQIMRKDGSVPESKVAAMESPAWEKALADAPNSDVQRVWDSLPAEAKTNASAVGAYAKRLSDIGQADKAEAVVHKSINSSFDESLAGLYGDIESSNTAKQLENAERWAQTNSSSPALLSTIGKLAGKRELWSKARDNMVKSAQVDLNPGICNDLGEVMEAMGDKASAVELFKNASRLAAGKSPVGMLTDLPALASKLGK